jgi:hypothetical protein
MTSRIVVLMLGVGLPGVAPNVEAREWTSRQGTKLAAELIAVVPSALVLSEPSGKVREVPLRQLSESDQMLVKSMKLPSGAITGEAAASRKWTSSAGTTLLARLVEVKVVVYLQAANRKIHQIPLEFFSQSDRQFLQSLSEPQPRAAQDSEEPKPDRSPVPRPGASALPRTAWTMNPEELLAPERPLSGELVGLPFRIDEAELHEGTLVFRGGGLRSPRTVTVHLFPKVNESVDSKTYRMPGTGMRAPVVTLAWGDENSEKSETFLGEYAMLLELGEPNRDRLPGRLYLCFPDSQRSYLAGQFAAKILPPGSPEGR